MCKCIIKLSAEALLYLSERLHLYGSWFSGATIQWINSTIPGRMWCDWTFNITAKILWWVLWKWLASSYRVPKYYLDFDHVQGPGKLEHIKCSVIFTALVPVDIQSCPFIVFTSHGIHQHPPPPPHKPPELILRGVERIIKQMRNPSLTLGMWNSL